MHADMTKKDKDISSGIISHYFPTQFLSFLLFPSPPLQFLCLCVCVRVCVHEHLTDLTQSLSSLETQWSHLISHASDALMNQHTLCPSIASRGCGNIHWPAYFSQADFDMTENAAAYTFTYIYSPSN